jgi:beta-galactosidase
MLDVPHDWSVEPLPGHPESTGAAALWTENVVPHRLGPFDADRSEGQTATGFVVGGTGWYRKHFSAEAVPADRVVEVRFDGVYMNADVWLNGEQVGTHPYGYTGFTVDLTPHLLRQENVLAVRVRNEGKNSRWYSGSGIYRHVWLVVTRPVRVATWGLAVHSENVSARNASARVVTTVENRGRAGQPVTVRLVVRDSAGTIVGRQEQPGTAPAAGRIDIESTVVVADPRLWSTASPSLYRAEVDVVAAGAVVDQAAATFGLRTIEVDAARGLRINGEAVSLRGGCLHHDNGVLGAAAIDRAEERRVELMKANGFNAIRTSHNPPSPAFLEACDRLGVLVIDEAFDCWHEGNKNPDDYHKYFDDWWQRDLDAMILRDRNHPSVIFWSIGNEIHERAEPAGVALAERLVAEIKRLDRSRPVTMAVCEFWDYPNRTWVQTDPAFLHLDVGGYNYQWKQYAPDHERFSQRVMMGTESYPLEAYDNWEAVETHSWVLGDFVWTGMDYLGETGIAHSHLDKESAYEL